MDNRLVDRGCLKIHLILHLSEPPKGKGQSEGSHCSCEGKPENLFAGSASLQEHLVKTNLLPFHLPADPHLLLGQQKQQIAAIDQVSVKRSPYLPVQGGQCFNLFGTHRDSVLEHGRSHPLFGTIETGGKLIVQLILAESDTCTHHNKQGGNN